MSKDNLFSLQNGLPIRRGVILVAGPDNKMEREGSAFDVVQVTERGVDCLECNNNVWFFTHEEAQTFYVASYKLSDLDWYREAKIHPDAEKLSEICAGEHDKRFGK